MDYAQIQATLRNGFRSGRTKNIEYRKYQLLQLAYMLQDNIKRLEEALAADLGRPPLESQLYAPKFCRFVVFTGSRSLPWFSLEIGPSMMDARSAWAGVDKWAKTERAPFSINGFAMRPVIYKEPKGVVLIISPFNYPVWLCMSPLVCLFIPQLHVSHFDITTSFFHRPVPSQLAMPSYWNLQSPLLMLARYLLSLFQNILIPSWLRLWMVAFPKPRNCWIYLGIIVRVGLLCSVMSYSDCALSLPSSLYWKRPSWSYC